MMLDERDVTHLRFVTMGLVLYPASRQELLDAAWDGISRTRDNHMCRILDYLRAHLRSPGATVKSACKSLRESPDPILRSAGEVIHNALKAGRLEPGQCAR